jgi:plasmid stabilization system protein ParE
MACELIWAPSARLVYRVKLQARIVEIVRVWHAARGIPQL